MSKLGPHLMPGSDITRWIAAGARVFKADPTQLGASAQIPPGPLVVGKLDQQDNNLNLTDWKAYYNQGWTPEQTAEHRFNAQRNIYVGANKPRVDRYRLNPRIDVWEYDNEVVPDSPEEAQWFTAYCIEMMKLFDSIGRKYALFNFAIGTPDIKPGHAADIWPHLLPAVAHARDSGHYIGLHEYMGYEADFGVGWRQIDARRQPVNRWHGRTKANGQPDTTYPYGYAVLRYRWIYDQYFKPAGYGDVKLLITECGCDSVETVTPLGISVGTWKEHGPHWAAEGKDPETHYAAMLAWYDKFLVEDSFVAGATVFTVGSVGIWANWDIAGTRAETHLLHHIETAADVSPSKPVEEAMTFNQRIWDYSVDIQLHKIPNRYGLQLNPGAALQRRIAADGGTGLQIVTEEATFENHRFQVAENATTGERFLYYVPVSDLSKITVLKGKGATLEGVQGGAPATVPFRFEAWPTAHRVVTQEFGANPQNYARFGLPGHEGVDIRAPHGSPIYAVADGQVYLKTGNEGNYGIQVRLEHQGEWKTIYAHLDRAVVIQSQKVKAGEIVGYADNTGNSSGSHLHLTLKRDGENYVDRFGTWPNNIVDPTPFLAEFEGVTWPGGSPGIPVPQQPPAAGELIDLRRFKIADPDCWRVVRAMMQDGRIQNEDVQDMDLGGGLFVRRKGNNGEWHKQDGQFFYLLHDTSPDVGKEGVARCYTLHKGGAVGAPKSKVQQRVGEQWTENGTHYVQFRAKSGCLPLAENSGPATNSSVIVRYEKNFTFNRFGQNLKFDEVLWEKTGVETQLYGRKDGRSCGWIGWSAPWGESEPVEIHWNRGRLTQEPKRYCNW